MSLFLRSRIQEIHLSPRHQLIAEADWIIDLSPADGHTVAAQYARRRGARRNSSGLAG